MGAAAVDVCRADALVTGEAANLDVLLDDQDQLFQSLIDGLIAHLAVHQGLNVSRVLLHDDLGSPVSYTHLIQKKFNFSGWKESVISIVFIVLSFVIGANVPLVFGKAAWSYITFVYIFFAAVLPICCLLYSSR